MNQTCGRAAGQWFIVSQMLTSGELRGMTGSRVAELIDRISRGVKVGRLFALGNIVYDAARAVNRIEFARLRFIFRHRKLCWTVAMTRLGRRRGHGQNAVNKNTKRLNRLRKKLATDFDPGSAQ